MSCFAHSTASARAATAAFMASHAVMTALRNPSFVFQRYMMAAVKVPTASAIQLIGLIDMTKFSAAWAIVIPSSAALTALIIPAIPVSV